MRDEFTGEHSRLVARMRAQLWKYYPQFQEVVGATFHPWLLELWQRVPTPTSARRVRPATIEKLLGRHGVRRIDTREILRILRSDEMNVSQATVQSCVMRIASIAEHMKVVMEQVKETEKQIDRRICSLSKEQSTQGRLSDVEILNSFPGVGRVILAAILGEAYELVCRRDYKSLRNLCGSAPVTRQSGKSRRVTQRRASHKRLVDALYHWARVAVLHDPTSKAKYVALRKRGHGYYRTLRSVADRLLYIACTLLEKGVLFDKNFAKGGLTET